MVRAVRGGTAAQALSFAPPYPGEFLPGSLVLLTVRFGYLLWVLVCMSFQLIFHVTRVLIFSPSLPPTPVPPTSFCLSLSPLPSQIDICALHALQFMRVINFWCPACSSSLSLSLHPLQCLSRGSWPKPGYWKRQPVSG